MSPIPRDIAEKTASWPVPARDLFCRIRETVHDAAARAEIGPLTETLKWGQPSWLPRKPRIGTTLRCGWDPDTPEQFSLYVHCQTTLIETMKTLYPNAFEYDGNRAMRMPLNGPSSLHAIDHCAFLTLTYHRKIA
ncbi:hypothetical protein [uncultured Roseobacter sp.]|uniref:hypothetical protein n=1 Tax=uncultured Roseobacter sp. TaxID=114847 RepID=UPI00260E1947|nr:hypothetical protein [uncultured Roseobacter sp.]